jgi:hypothetical protein
MTVRPRQALWNIYTPINLSMEYTFFLLGIIREEIAHSAQPTEGFAKIEHGKRSGGNKNPACRDGMQ